MVSPLYAGLALVEQLWSRTEERISPVPAVKLKPPDP